MLNKLVLAMLFSLCALGFVVVIAFTIIDNSCSEGILSSHLSPGQNYEALVVAMHCNVTTSPVVRVKVQRKGTQSFRYFLADFIYPTNSKGQLGLDIDWANEKTIMASFATIRNYSTATSSIEFGDDIVELEVAPR